MQGRTFFRILIDNLFVNNPVCKAVFTLVNFCNNSMLYNKKNLKFLKKMPLNKTRSELSYKNRFIFESSYTYGANAK